MAPRRRRDADAPGVAEIVINGRFLRQRATGVQRVAREFVMALERLLAEGAFPHIRFRMVAPAGTDFSSLGLRHIRTEHLRGGTGHLWEQVALPRRAASACLLCLGNSAPLLSLVRGDHVAVMLHDQAYRLFPVDYSLPYRLVHTVLGRLILRHARPLFTVSETERAAIRATNPGARADIVVAPNGSWIDDQVVVPGDSGDRVGSYGLYVGGFSDRKNIDGVFATAATLAESGLPFRLVGAPNDRSEAFRASLGEVGRKLIRFSGYVTNAELETLYREAAYLLYPSFYEASGLPPSEAMTFGCPVVVSDLPVMRERCGDAALYCDPHDRAAIAAAALRIACDPALAADLSRRGRERVRQFSWRNQALIIVRAIEDSAHVAR